MTITLTKEEYDELVFKAIESQKSKKELFIVFVDEFKSCLWDNQKSGRMMHTVIEMASDQMNQKLESLGESPKPLITV